MTLSKEEFYEVLLSPSPKDRACKNCARFNPDANTASFEAYCKYPLHVYWKDCVFDVLGKLPPRHWTLVENNE